MERKDVKNYVEQLNTYLNEFKEKTGLNFKVSSISYTADDFTCKINFTKMTQEEVYNKNSTFFGKYPYGTVINYKGDTYKIVEYKSRATKYPYIVESSKGKRFKVDETWIQNYKAV